MLLLLPMAPGIGKDVNGARIWIHVGPMSFQPGEVAKVLLVLTFAGYLVLHRDALALAGRRVRSSTCRAAATSARSWRCGWSASASWSSSTTSAPACSSSASS